MVERKMGICVICGRKLTNPISIERRMGPTCYKKVKDTKPLDFFIKKEKEKARCRVCRKELIYDKEYDELGLLCNRYCCIHCPYVKLHQCPLLELTGEKRK